LGAKDLEDYLPALRIPLAAGNVNSLSILPGSIDVFFFEFLQ